ncbi:MAG TPA: hypothetical protein VGX23_26365 [Actinocrinis sp.]|nr:hypothetical protein [Actinocrinis sp.]
MSVEDLDGEWWSPKFRYAFRLAVRERCGYATVTNAPRVYRVGQRLLRIEYVNEGGFSGVQMFADGGWVPVVALLAGPDELRMTGGCFSWRMHRVPQDEVAQDTVLAFAPRRRRLGFPGRATK